VSASGAIADGIQAMELEDYKRGLARSPQPTPAKRQRPTHPASNLGPHVHHHQQQQQQDQAQDASAALASANGSSGGASQPSDRSDGDGGPAMEVGSQHLRTAASSGRHISGQTARTSPASSTYGRLSSLALPAAFCCRKDRPWSPLQEVRSEVSLATSPGKGRTAFEIAAAIAPSASK
jgi:hypothetical protein